MLPGASGITLARVFFIDHTDADGIAGANTTTATRKPYDGGSDTFLTPPGTINLFETGAGNLGQTAC